MAKLNARRRTILRLLLINVALPLFAAGYALAFRAAQANGLPLFDCVFHRLFGIYCPGCGGSRSVANLLRLQFGKSFWYYPAIPYTAALLAWWDVLLVRALARRADVSPDLPRWTVLAIPVLILATFVFRLVAMLVFHFDPIAALEAGELPFFSR